MKRFLTGLLLMMVLVVPVCAFAETDAGNLLSNGGFEQVNAAGEPDGWYTVAYRTQEGYTRFEITSEKAHTGSYSAKITNANMNDARYVFDVPVQPERMYRVTGYVLVDGMDDSGNGANLAVEGVYAFSQCLFDTQGQWKYVEWYGETGEDQTEIQLGVRIGGYGAESQGTAYFDDITVQEVQTLPDGIIASLWYTLDTGSAAAAANTATTTTTGKSTVLFVVLCALFLQLVWAVRSTLRGGTDLTRTQSRVTMLAFVLAMLAAFAARLALGALVPGYQVDMNCFSAWSLRMASEGPIGFYAEGYFCDYPPGYMLLLWPIGLLIRAVGYADSPEIRLLVKAIPIVCDMAGALILFQYAKKRVPQRAAVFAALLFALNPAALVNGAAWGQVDSVLGLLLLLTAITAMQQDWRKALPLMAVAILLKPQALLFLPVGGIWLILCLVKADRAQRKAAWKSIGWGVGIAVAIAAAIIVPFSLRQSDPWWLIALYQKTLSSYNYATLNTANLMYILGGNWSALAADSNSTVKSLSWLVPAISGLGLMAAGLGMALRRVYPQSENTVNDHGSQSATVEQPQPTTKRHNRSKTDTGAKANLTGQHSSGIVPGDTVMDGNQTDKPQSHWKEESTASAENANRSQTSTESSLRKRLRLTFWEPIRMIPEKVRTHEPWGTAARKAVLGLLCAGFGLAFLLSACFPAIFLTYGTLWMVFVYAFALAYLLTEGTADALPFTMALMLAGVYVLGLKIHERYLFAALMLLPLGYARTKDRRLLWLCAGFSVTTFLNTAIVLDNAILFGAAQGHLNADTLGLNIAIGIANLLLWFYAMHIAFTGTQPTEERVAPAVLKQDRRASYRAALLQPKDARLRLTGRDYLIMGVTAILYAMLTFTNLGSMRAPQTAWVATSPAETVTLELDRDQTFKMLYYAGVSYNNFSVSVSDDGENWSDPFPCEMREGLCYRWNYAVTSNDQGAGSVTFDDNNPDNILWLTGRYVRVNAESAGLNLWEIILRNEDGNQIPLKLVGHEGSKDVLATAKPPENLIDEQDTLEGEPGWLNGTYFDEIYHARTAYEHLHGLAPYETTHPPLGKLIMSLGIAMFGMTPFGWRFMGALVGVLMLPAIYLLARQLTRKRDLATFVMVLFSLDLMHFTQTRIATIDSFPVFFILLSTLCMVRYLMTDAHAVPDNLTAEAKPRVLTRAFLRTLIPLALCGLFMGLSIASKWIGLYSAVGLAVMFAIAVYRQFREGLTAFDEELDQNLTPEQTLRVRWTRALTLRRILVTCAFCVLFFIAVPALIYYLSYIPYLSPTGPVTLSRLIKAQIGMYNYQSTPGLGMDHPFYSPWWQWPLILKPMWFCQDKFEPTGWASTIMCMGNPLIYYVGAASMLVMFALFIRKVFSFRGGLRLRAGNGDLSVPLVVLGFLTQYLPWVLVPRSMYMYHYFASVPFIILATALLFDRLRGPKLRRRAMIAYVVLVAVFFALFFPYASGLLTPTWWMDWLKWFPKIYY